MFIAPKQRLRVILDKKLCVATRDLLLSGKLHAEALNPSKNGGGIDYFASIHQLATDIRWILLHKLIIAADDLD